MDPTRWLVFVKEREKGKKRSRRVGRNRRRKYVSPVFVAQTGSVGMLVRSRLGVQDLQGLAEA